MKSFDLNLLPEQLQAGSITRKEAVNLICSFISNNYPVFGLQKYDEDFRSDLILKIIERGEHLLDIYMPENGNFFCFLHTYISSLINTKLKSLYKESLTRKIRYEEYLLDTEEKMLKYQKLDYSTIESKKFPYAPDKIPAEELSKTLRDIAETKTDKKLLVLALKSSFYITDEQIKKVCDVYKIQPSFLYPVIQFCKNSVLKRKNHRDIFQERRNFAYYHHKRYKRMLENLSDETTNADIKRLKFKILEERHRSNWKKLNESFEKGLLNLRPTNKTIANLLGICERQVTYCLNCARKDAEKLDSEKIEAEKEEALENESEE